jgi:predicted DNA-binding transcriptional regulator AlpA
MQTRYIRPRDLASTKSKPGRWPVTTSTLWRWVAAGVLPQPVKLGPQVAAWPMEVIEAYEAAQAAAAPIQTAQRPTQAAHRWLHAAPLRPPPRCPLERPRSAKAARGDG